ncbi:hypothetical protein [Herbaspirillum robiniae]|uniref:hypothetical protein n=1 Tax=Herbaspirillum robiniae TaxID=2014887 RepID=UPI0009A22EBE|nr:hypothetical protein [Herbaspirillum robiniae]
MNTDLLARLAKHAKDAHKLAAKLDCINAPDAHAAKKANINRADDVQQLDRHLHEIHCLAVELGVADAQPHRYGEKRINLGFGREILDPRRFPAVKDSLTAQSPDAGKES